MGADNKPSETPTVPNPCSVCGFPIFGSTIGTGDGTMKDGGSFAHPECYFEERCGQLERSNVALRKALEPFARCFDPKMMVYCGDTERVQVGNFATVTLADLENARAALQGGK